MATIVTFLGNEDLGRQKAAERLERLKKRKYFFGNGLRTRQQRIQRLLARKKR